MSYLVLTPAARRKLLGCVRLLASNSAGEVFAALSAIERILPQDVDLSDLVERALGPEQGATVHSLRPWQRRAHIVLGFDHLLTAKDREFVRNIARFHGPISDRQWRWLERIEGDVELARAA